MANLTLPQEVRRAFVAAIAEARCFDYSNGGRYTLDPDAAYDSFMDNLAAEGFRVVRVDAPAP